MADIICVDDDEQMRTVLGAILSRGGHEVRLCGTRVEAINAFNERKPDLVLLDVLMPDASGLDICRELRKHPEAFSVPIVMLSAVQDEECITDCLSSGADDYLLKPLNRAELLAKVGVALQKRAAGQDADKGLNIGARFAGRFDIIELVGAGGFSSVFRAHDTTLNTEVALKVFDLPSRHRNDRNFIAGFLREAYELSRVDFDTIVRFLDFGQTGKLYFLVMEFLDGESIEEAVDGRGPLDERSLVTFGYQVARAIQYLGEQKILHRDIKPSNILLTTDGKVKLLDFGLAKTISDITLSLPEELLITPVFAPPEAFERKPKFDTSSDLYSLGATLHFAGTGELPFPGETLREIMASHYRFKPPLLSKVNPAIGSKCAALIDRMLSVEREDRPGIDEVLTFLQSRL